MLRVLSNYEQLRARVNIGHITEATGMCLKTVSRVKGKEVVWPRSQQEPVTVKVFSDEKTFAARLFVALTAEMTKT